MDLNIIPTVAWGKEEDLTWCFEGLPTNSSIAISTNGCKSEPYSKKLFLLGVEELQTKLTPFKEALINCEKRINRMPPINPLSHHISCRITITYGNLRERSEEPLLNAPP